MTDEGRDDGEMRALLEKIAARAGDPPEHGLEEIATLRRRRARHRRGAVATAVALAVTLVAASSLLARLGDHTDDVTSVADAGTTPRPAELPDTVELRCTPHGIDVPVASIRPQPDGLHLKIDNQLPAATEVWVTSEVWDSGRVVVQPGRDELRQPVPPGELTVGCRIEGRDEQRLVDLVDVDGIYDEPHLDCPVSEQDELTEPIAVDPPTWSRVGATTSALATYLEDGDRVEPPGGYPDEQLTDPTADPIVRVVRDEETVAFVHLASGSGTGTGTGTGSRTETGVAGQGDQAERSGATSDPDEDPWSQVRLVEACAGFLAPGGGATGSTGADAPS